MIIESLTLRNFGTYLGEHQLTLAPQDRTRPVTLIGGLNGAGKTTLLEAMQLGLYGRASPIALSSSATYERLLSDRISRLVPASDGASIELRLRTFEDGRERVLTIRRAWSVRHSKLREDVTVFVDGVLDRFLSDNWGEASDRVFPSRLASLFFFDGEKIESLAHPESAREAIRTAVETLLGLDLVRQLESDLATLTRMKVKNSAASAEARTRADVIERLEAALVSVRGEITELSQQAASVQNSIDRVQAELDETERELERTGGLAFENRHQLERAVVALRAERTANEEGLRRLAEGDLPLALLREPLGELLSKLKMARADRAGQAINDALRAQGDALISYLRETLPDGHGAIALVRSFLADTQPAPVARATRARSEEVVAVPSAEGRLGFLSEHLDALVSEASVLVGILDGNSHSLLDVERGLAAIPDEAVVQVALMQRRALIEKRHEYVQAQGKIQGLLEHARSELEKLRVKLDREVQEQAASVERSESEQRLIDHAGRAVATLEHFRSRLVQRHTERLGEAVLSRFRHLVRKDRLVARIEIDTEDFGLNLFDDQGMRLPAGRLSAGERQLLAVALLWGLSNASGRALPVVVDTPLGRLDSQHRRNFVERYLPSVSHQTIVLSTDEEVDGTLLELMAPHVSQSYLLSFENDLGHSIVKPGYFGSRLER